MFIKYSLYIALILSLISCQFTETIIINEDGSGTISLEQDYSNFIKIASSMASDLGESEEKVDNLNGEKIDTLFYFKDFIEEYKDSISKLSKSEQERINNLKNYSISAKIDSDEDLMLISLGRPFKDINKLSNTNLFEDYNLMSASSFGGKDEKMNSAIIDGAPKNHIYSDFSFKNNKFKRSSHIIDEEQYKRDLDSLKDISSFMEGSTYTLKYVFPKKIKSVSNPSAIISKDKKTMTLTVPFTEYYLDPKVLDIEIELY